jgi:hypothetical protein
MERKRSAQNDPGLVGALCFSRGEQRFSLSFRNELLFRWTEVQLPPAEAGGSHPIRGG